MKPRFRAEWEVSSEELCILASWFSSPMSKNSVNGATATVMTRRLVYVAAQIADIATKCLYIL